MKKSRKIPNSKKIKKRKVKGTTPRKSISFLKFGVGRVSLIDFLRFREVSTTKDVFEFTSNVWKHRNIENMLSPCTFPEKLSDIDFQDSLGHLGNEKDFVWMSALLSKYSQELSSFSKLRNSFEKTFLASSWDECEEVLSVIKKRFGASLWHTSRLLQVSYFKGGLTKLQGYIETLVKDDNVQPILALLVVGMSMRCQESYSIERILTEFGLDVDANTTITNLFTFYICPYYTYRIKNPENLIIAHRKGTVIDRYVALISMLELYSTRCLFDKREIIKSCITSLGSIKDDRLLKISSVFNGISYREDLIQDYDKYTVGDYNQISTGVADLVELRARANLLCEREENPVNLEQEISQAMSEMLVVSRNYSTAKERLKRIALNCIDMPVVTKIVSFVERQPRNPSENKYDDIDYLLALQTGENPWSSIAMCDFYNRSQYSEDVSKKHLFSSSIKLQKSIVENTENGLILLDSLNIPRHRSEMHRAHLFYNNNEYGRASVLYRRLMIHQNIFVRARARIFLFDLYYKTNQINLAIELIVEHYLESPSVIDIYPLAELAELTEVNVTEPGPSDSLFLVVFYSLCSRFVDQKYDAIQSDYYETVLMMFDVGVPSDILVDDVRACRKLQYFFRYVCVQRVMDDQYIFSNQSQVEQERIRICKILNEVDPVRSKDYLFEIKSIVREEKIYEYTDHAHTTKVYVDTDGVLSFCDEKLKVFYDGITELKCQPEYREKSEDISKRLRKLFGSRIQEDLKDLSLPSSEHDSLFSGMLHYFVGEFSFNKEYGLDVNISSSIRHGAFEGALRSPFTSRRLLSDKTENDGYKIKEEWSYLENELGKEKFSLIIKLMNKFTENMGSLVDYYLNEVLRVRSDQHMNGGFNFYRDSEYIENFSNQVGGETSYNEFKQKLMEYVLVILDESMEGMKSGIKLDLTVKLNRHISKLEKGLKSVDGLQGSKLLVDLNDAKHDLIYQLDLVASWFRRSSDELSGEFDLDIIVDVARLQVGACYADVEFSEDVLVENSTKIKGKYFRGLLEVFFILFQNMALKGRGNKDEGNMLVDIRNNKFIIHVNNPLMEGSDSEHYKSVAMKCMEKFDRNSALDAAGKEGDSGFSKIWKILHIDFKAQGALKVSVINDDVFRTELEFECDMILQDRKC